MKTNNLPMEAQLWGELYGLLCRWDSVRLALASMSMRDKHVLDDKAEELIKEYLSIERKIP